MLALIGQCIASPAAGNGVPVHDGAAEATRLEQVAHLVDQLTTMRRQLEAARANLQALTGAAGYGAWDPGSLVSTLPAGQGELAGILSGQGDTGASAVVREQLREYFQLELEASPEAVRTTASVHNERVWGLQGLEAIARTAYEKAAQDERVITALSAAIDRAQSVKASMDLQNRLMAQNAASVLAAARMIAATEAAAARQRRLDAERALRLRRLAIPRFLNPRFSR